MRGVLVRPQHFDEGAQEVVVKLGEGLLLDDIDGFERPHGFLVRPGGRQGIKDIRNSADPGTRVDIFHVERIPQAVRPLVMLHRDVGSLVRKVPRFDEYGVSPFRVFLHDGPFILVQFSPFSKNCQRHP